MLRMRFRGAAPESSFHLQERRGRSVDMLRQLRLTFDWKDSGKWTFLAMVVGVIAGTGAIVFQLAMEAATDLSLIMVTGYDAVEAHGEHSYFDAEAAPFSPWKLLAVISAGGLLAGIIVQWFAPEAEGHGTDAAIEAYHQKRGVIRARIPFVKTIASAITIGTGGSGGKEGPIAQIGAAFGSYLATILNLSARDRRILLAAGMGAGVGAIFRAPLAGALFAAEILYSESDFEADVIIPAATASIIAYSLYCLSLPLDVRYIPLFGSTLSTYRFHSPMELIPYAVLAIIVSIVAVLYIKVFYGTHKLFAKLPGPKLLRPVLGAFLTGVVGLLVWKAFQQDDRSLAVLATGYGTLQASLVDATKLGIPLLVTVGLVKILTTSLTISSGGSGGVFGPSMVIGGCIGAAVGLAFHQILAVSGDATRDIRHRRDGGLLFRVGSCPVLDDHHGFRDDGGLRAAVAHDVGLDVVLHHV